ncbi:5-hydroxyisourate hydrolase [Pyrenophora teres f. maculata]|nr:5-hydroxyisourate hydrolase [Pyrenophora teres f. maculata]
MSTPTTPKPPITCHILDTTLGRPAPSIPVTLTLHNPSSTTSTTTPLKFTSTTNTDGRVTAWEPATPFSSLTLHDAYAAQEGDASFSLTFDTGAYFHQRGIAAFFPEVVVRFLVREAERKAGEHFHVPVLVGPFGYTTYRGS